MNSTEENPSAESPFSNRKRRRWFRFSLRTFLIVIALFAVTIGWYVDRAERQRRSVQWIEEHGGTVYYYNQTPDDRFQSGSLAGMTWLRERVPIHYLASVDRVRFLKHARFTELDFVRGIPFVREIILDDFVGSDLSPLAELSRLRHFQLHVDNTPDVDLSPLANLRSLKELEIYTVSGILGFDSLAELVQLEKLEIVCDQLPDLKPIAAISNLKRLSLYGDVADISALRTLNSIESLDLSGNDRLNDLSPITEYEHLRSLHIADTAIADLRPLRSLNSLEELSLVGTNVADLTPLTSLKNLQALHLWDTTVRDLEPLKELPQLVYLQLHDMPIPIEQIRSLQSALPNCTILALQKVFRPK